MRKKCAEWKVDNDRAILERQLMEIGFTCGMPTLQAQQRNQRIADLQPQLDALPPAEPTEIGTLAGYVHIGGLMGSAPLLPPLENPNDEGLDDPFLRFERDCKEERR